MKAQQHSSFSTNLVTFQVKTISIQWNPLMCMFCWAYNMKHTLHFSTRKWNPAPRITLFFHLSYWRKFLTSLNVVIQICTVLIKIYFHYLYVLHPIKNKLKQKGQEKILKESLYCVKNKLKQKGQKKYPQSHYTVSHHLKF